MTTMVVSAVVVMGTLVRSQTAGVQSEVDTAALAARLQRAVVVLRDATTRAAGTGFLVDRSGLVVTNAHVIDAIARPEAVLADGSQVEVEAVLTLDHAHDVAVLKVTARALEPLTLSGAEPALGARVWSLGSPARLDFTFASGTVASIRRDGFPEELRTGDPWERTPKLQLDFPGAAGASGSPVVNAAGEVVGMLQSGLGPQSSFAFAVPAAELARLVQMARRAGSPQRVFSSTTEIHVNWMNLGWSAVAVVAAFLVWRYISGRRLGFR